AGGSQPLERDGVVLWVSLPADETASESDRGHAGCSAAGEGVEDQVAGVREVANQLLHECLRLRARMVISGTLGPVPLDGAFCPDRGAAAAVPAFPALRVRDLQRLKALRRAVAGNLRHRVGLHPDPAADVEFAERNAPHLPPSASWKIRIHRRAVRMSCSQHGVATSSAAPIDSFASAKNEGVAGARLPRAILPLPIGPAGAVLSAL